MSTSWNHGPPRVEILQPSLTGAGERRNGEVELRRLSAEPPRRKARGQALAGAGVGLLTLACTSVALLDLFLLAFHVA